MQLTVRQGSEGPTIRFLLLQDQSDAESVSGLAAQSEGLRVAYIRDGEARPTPVPLVPWEGAAPGPGAFREVDPEAMPGLYELALPDAVCAEGARRATLMIQAPHAAPHVVHLDLVAYDPYDRYRLGLDCLAREARHDVISTAFREVVPEIVEEFRRQM